MSASVDFCCHLLAKRYNQWINLLLIFYTAKQNISGQSCEWILMNCPETSLWPGLSLNWSRSGSVSAGWSFLFLEEADRDLWASSTDWLVCEVSEVWGGGEAGGWGGKEKTGNCVSGAGGGSVYDLTEQEGEEKRAEKASFTHSPGGEETEKGSIDPRWSDSSSSENEWASLFLSDFLQCW